MTIATGTIVAAAGQVGIEESGEILSDDFEAQSRRAFDNVGQCLASAGRSFADVIKATAFLVDLAELGTFNRLHADYFKPPYPARTTCKQAWCSV